ncbi:hypothetical protein GCM10027317_33830 [Massilia agri]
MQGSADRFLDRSHGHYRRWRIGADGAICTGAAAGSRVRAVIVAVFILRCDSLRRRGGMIVPAILSLTGHRRLHRHASGMVSVGGQGMMRHAALEPRHSRNALQREGDDE